MNLGHGIHAVLKVWVVQESGPTPTFETMSEPDSETETSVEAETVGADPDAIAEATPNATVDGAVEAEGSVDEPESRIPAEEESAEAE